MEIVFFRCALGVVFCYVGLRKADADWKVESKTAFDARAFRHDRAVFFLLTVQNIPLASAMTIQYLSPIFTTIIAIYLLKESVKFFSLVLLRAAFRGVLFIEQFDARVTLCFSTLGVTSAFCSGWLIIWSELCASASIR
jgi:threonine/homoserine efflux transporter RhtA